MNLYKEFIKDARDYNGYEDLKANFKISIPENFNFAYDVVDRYEKDAPEKRAMLWVNDYGDEKTFTFTDIARESRRVANFLTAQGIKKGDAVMLILRRRFEFWFFMIALHRIGAIAIPATAQLLAKDIEYRNNCAGVKMIVSLASSKLKKEMDEALEKSPTVEKLVWVKNAAEPDSYSLYENESDKWLDFDKEIAKYDDNFARPTGNAATTNDDVMILYFTSGTSGYPKMVQHNFAYPLGHIVTAKYWQNVVDDGLHLTVAETGWAKAVWGKIYGQWIAGTGIFTYDMDTFKPGIMLEKIAKYKITTFCAPPTIYRYFIRQNFDKYDLSALTYCVTAGEALNPEVKIRFKELTGITMMEAYGQTESTVICGNFVGMKDKDGSMGKPAPGYNVEIVDETGKPVAPGEKGEIIIHVEDGRPFGLFSGYYKDDDLTKAAFEGGLYHTGDTAYMDEDGYVFFIGRNDDIIKSAGYRISPFEVESVLQQHPAVLECAVTGVEDKGRGQLVKATIVLNKGYEASNDLANEIQEFVKNLAANYKRPRLIEFVDELPKTISGKIRRVEIRENDAK
ncbi:MAG: AMP-binding protein [Treponema sp.]|nr:AMP-binding protein [Treponema sp.]